MLNKKKKVLMLGPSLKAQGGISAVVQKYYEAGICDYAKVRYISTTTDSNKIIKTIVALVAFIKVLFLTPFYEVMHVHLASRNSFRRKYYYLCYFFLLKKKVIIHLHGGEFDKYFLNECNKRIQSKIRKTFIKSNRVIVLSDEWYNKIISIIGSEIKEKTIVLNNAVSVPAHTHKDYLKNSIIFLGRLVPEKGLIDIFKCVAEIKKEYTDFSITICGGGDIEKYQSICENLNIQEQISFVGWISGVKKENLLREATIFLLPSYNEGLPVSMLEAMSYGLACIVSDVGGIPSVIKQNENGIMISPGNVNLLKDALCSLLNNPQKKELIGKAAYFTIVQKFNIEKNLEYLIDIYNEL